MCQGLEWGKHAWGLWVGQGQYPDMVFRHSIIPSSRGGHTGHPPEGTQGQEIHSLEECGRVPTSKSSRMAPGPPLVQERKEERKGEWCCYSPRFQSVLTYIKRQIICKLWCLNINLTHFLEMIPATHVFQ